MSTDKMVQLLWVAAITAALSGPLGDAVGFVLSAGQDGPGTALMYAFGDILTIIAWVASTGLILSNPGKALDRLKKSVRIPVVLSILVLPATAIVGMSQSQTYTLRASNESGVKIDDVTISMAGRRYALGILPHGKFAAIAFQHDRPKGIAEVSWIDIDGRSYMDEVDLSDMIPRRYDNGLLDFTIDANGNVQGSFFIQPDVHF
ncbi:MAG: hypothetical protein HKN77_00740 [Woeseiaceae bacterium]|nr:hypothetical protein [Woeseiaceae bacterium]